MKFLVNRLIFLLQTDGAHIRTGFHWLKLYQQFLNVVGTVQMEHIRLNNGVYKMIFRRYRTTATLPRYATQLLTNHLIPSIGWALLYLTYNATSREIMWLSDQFNTSHSTTENSSYDLRKNPIIMMHKWIVVLYYFFYATNRQLSE